MKYRKRKYKYQLVEPHVTQTGIFGYDFDTIYFSLTPDGVLTGKTLYAWDGCSGPTVDDEDRRVEELNNDTSRTAVPGLDHDMKYQALRLGLLPLELKTIIDREFHDALIDRGFNPLRADIWHMGVHFGGGSSCVPGTDNDDIMEAF
jgi:hypothetical protein